MLFIDAATFKPITLNGREIVSLDPRGEKFPWKFPVSSSKITESVSKAVNPVTRDRASSTSTGSSTPVSDTDTTIRQLSPKAGGAKPADAKPEDVKKVAEVKSVNVSPVGAKASNAKKPDVKRQSMQSDSNKVDNKGSAQMSKIALN